MIYACSDIHGNLDRYNKVIQKITSDDELYILGDAIDRGEYGLEILKDILSRDNVHFIMGNHEYMMLNVLLLLLSDSLSVEDFKNSEDFKTWVDPRNGGGVTYNNLSSIEPNVVSDILNLFINSPIFVRINVNGRKFHLSHASALAKYRGRDSLCINDMSQEELIFDLFNLVWSSPFDTKHFSNSDEYDCDNETYILGHRPVQMFGGHKMINKDDRIFDIDGGCALGNSNKNSLILLCLDTMKEEYIV